MLSCPLKLSASRLPINSMPRTILPNCAYVIACPKYSTYGASPVKSICPCAGLGLFGSFKGLCSSRAMHKFIYPIPQSCKGLKSALFKEPDLDDKLQRESAPRESFDNVDDKEIQRRIKIGHRNKGKVPWNKGRKHSDETRERISRGTKEALRDPKVRKKMSEAPHILSNQTIAKIRTSVLQLWRKRLQRKRSREKLFQLWAESIAKAAKKGGSDQQELDWDSYDKLEREMSLLQIRQIAEKAKVKEMARIRAEREAQVKAEKMAMLTQKRREREENAKARGESIKKRNKNKSKEEKERLVEFQEEKLKERLMKIHKKKSAINKVSNQHQRLWEKFDLDFAKGLRNETSLADQIRSAKNRRSQ